MAKSYVTHWINMIIKQYAVIGNPIEHSLSPNIHEAFAKQTGLQIDYQKVLVPLNSFKETIVKLEHTNFTGLNITLPFKEEAWALATEKSDYAERAKAVNTLTFLGNNTYRGDNTDGIGLVRDLENNLALSLKGKSILILGAGGAVRGCIQPLLDKAPANITIANRTVQKALDLANEFSIEGCHFSDLTQAYDLIINGTSAELTGQQLELPPQIMTTKTYCYDMSYNKDLTSFLKNCKALGAIQLSDGLGMLVEQASESFFIWQGIRPETQGIIASLRRQ